MNQKNYITELGYTRLKESLHNLVTKERPTLVNTVNWAASNGDRSENGDYIYGKRRLREIDKQIHSLTKKVQAAEVVNSSLHVGQEKVFFGATVTLLRNNQIEQKVRIVGQDEIDPKLNHISWTSPLAKALLGKSLGETFQFSLASVNDLIEIIDVIY